MGDIGDTINETIPAVGTSGTTYATNINLFLTEVKNRLEAQVPRTSLEDGDLDLNGYDIQNALTVGFSEQLETPTTPTGTLQAYNGELYWVGAGGVVQITDGTTLNAGSIGGITGDYGDPNPAQFRFVDADQEYYAYDNYSTGAWAKIWARYLDIAAGNTGTTRLRLGFGGGSSYTLTFPSAVPATTQLLTMDTSGNLGFATRTVVQSVSPSAWKRDDSVEVVGADGFNQTGGWGAWAGPDNTSPDTTILHIPLSAPVGSVITGYTLYYYKNTANTHTYTCGLHAVTSNGGSSLNAATIDDNATGVSTKTVSGLSITVTAGTGYSVMIQPAAGTDFSTDVFAAFEFTYTVAPY